MVQSEENISDNILVERVIQGDKESYRILVDRYKNLVFRLAITMLNDCDAAEDAAQEAFIIAYNNLTRLRTPSLFGSWIAGITKNICREYIKKQKSDPLSLEYLADSGIEPGSPCNTDIVDKELKATIQKIILNLPGKYREVIDLRYSEGFSYKKLSDFLGITMSAVKSRLFNAKNEIIKRLKKEGLL